MVKDTTHLDLNEKFLFFLWFQSGNFQPVQSVNDGGLSQAIMMQFFEAYVQQQ